MYVIKHTFSWQKKNGELATMENYFKDHVNLLLPFNEMVGTANDAKQYEYLSEARRDKRKYFPNDKTVKIVKHKQ